MNSSGHILIVDDDAGVCLAARLALVSHFTQIETFNAPDGLDEVIVSRDIDAILLDMNFRPGANSGQDGLDWLDRLHRLDPSLSIVMMTAFGGVTLAVETLKRGAVDFVLKPWQNEKLIATLSAAVALTHAKREAETLRLRGAESAIRPGMMIGNAPSLSPVLRHVRRIAPTDAIVSIVGENGTGKETMAREIHRLSSRSHLPFVAVDLGTVPEAFVESELFGHRRGAFGGADADRAGRYQAAHGGTLYLDDIGSLPLHLQKRLLHVIEHQEVLPIGATKPVKVNVRLIVSSQRPLNERVEAEMFRSDLSMRLDTVRICVPPLRDRREDIPALLEHFLSLYARKHNLPRRRASGDVLKWIESYDWPGNIRELRHATERATLLLGDERLHLEDFPFLFTSRTPASEGGSYNLDEIERVAIGRAMSDFDGNITLAATALGLTRPALYRRLEKHGF
ncbi:sigma-54-dependent transcriptional regulator [Asticcacaulis benevestitus]|uniref:ATPase AAA n=1 Tax=Asticcacaulis benevestitus DSM 16100 = ATCC BAA-896 TaxID=1121022 RepID=V4P2D3_9CAUL|nr:sigma-54 dependent transcriptional regulator [Asticcacaulis benevestitus]ESQ88122.1 hypothetical protein ABENE_16465 [Asticcacaulis benevestitus DSM 16100 = ATCC BAA-896]